MNKKIVAVGVLAVVVIAGVVGWYLRSQTVLWGISEPGLRTLLVSVEADLNPRALGPSSFPWDTPDLVLRWVDPWVQGSPDPLVRSVSGPPPKELLAFEVFGLISSRQVVPPADFAKWATDLDKKSPGSSPLAVAAKSDTELLNLLLWFGEGVLGSDQLQQSWAALATDPASSVDPSGALPPTHPWAPIVEELRRWSASGRLAAQWWDFSDADVAAAVSEGRARWGLGWSGVHFSATLDGIPTSTLRLAPAWPGHRSLSLIGRWLFLESSLGWGDQVRVERAKAALSSASVGQKWLKRGLLLAGADLPAVNQETKALGLGLLSAGALIAAPLAYADVSRWKPLLEAVRATLRK